jgi:uncharacterized caspase-like protein
MRRRAVLAGLGGLSLGPSLGWARPSPGAAVAALAIGVSRYAQAPNLPSAARDAGLLASVFLRLGFDTDLVLNPSGAELLHALAHWRIRAQASGTAVLYVAGHGFLAGHETHILPADAALTPGHAPQGAIPETLLMRAVSDQPRHKILFLDTCRDLPILGLTNPMERAEASMLPAGAHLSYASQPAAPALDGRDGFSPFATALRDGLAQPGRDMSALARFVRLSVLRQTAGRQIPWDRSSLLAPVVLNRL